MDLRQLRYFVAVARERNFTRAAEQLHVAQPPLSRAIQQLEEDIGVPLLVRSSRPIKLTDAGRFLYEQSLQLLGRFEQTKANTRRLGKAERSVLSIGFVSSTLYGGLPQVLRHLRKHFPELDVQLVELLSAQQTEALKAGRIDVGFGRIRVADPAVERMIMREERLVIALPGDDPLLELGAGPLSLDVLEGRSLIVYPKQPRPSFADSVLSLLADRNVRTAEVMEVLELQTALGLVAAAVGLCVVPASARALRDDVVYRDIDDPQAISPLIMVHRANDQSPYLAVIRDFIHEMYRSDPHWLHGSRVVLPKPSADG